MVHVGQGNGQARGFGRGWIEHYGRATDVAVDAGGAMWALWDEAASGGRLLCRREGTSWVPEPVGGVRISGGVPGRVVLVTDTGAILDRTPEGWREIPGGVAEDVAAGPDGALWAVGSTEAPDGRHLYRWLGDRWEHAADNASAVRVALGPGEEAWAVLHDGSVSRWTHGEGWVRLPGRLVDVSVGADGSVWGLGALDGDHEGEGHEILWWDGSDWLHVRGAAVALDVGPDGLAWAVNASGGIYERVEQETGL